MRGGDHSESSAAAHALLDAADTLDQGEARFVRGKHSDWLRDRASRYVDTDVDTLRRVAKPSMVMRSVRVPLKLWNAARAKADEREENISDVIREALERYVRRR